MKLTATMIARNEAWCIAASAIAALAWCDDLVIVDHQSTDATADIVSTIARDNPGRVHMLTVAGEWNEADYRQAALIEARKHGATHIAVIDGDEVLTANLLPTIRGAIEAAPVGVMLKLPWIILWKSPSLYRTDGMWGSARAFVAFEDSPGVQWGAVGGMQFHTRFPGGVRFQDVGNRDGGGLIHLQFYNWRRALCKQVWYAMQEAIRYPGRTSTEEINAKYSRSLSEAGATYAPIHADWWPGGDFPKCEAEPWQEAECRRMVEKYGRAAFSGINLRGVC